MNSRSLTISFLAISCIMIAPAKALAKQCLPVTLTPLTLPDGSVGVPYSQNIDASGPGKSYTFSISANSLPPGLTISPTTGRISGTPTTTGTFSFQVKATDGTGCSGMRAYTVDIACGTIAVNPSSIPSVGAGTSYSQALSASGGGGSYSYAITYLSLPPGLTMSATGVISGVATALGLYSFTVRATDSNGCFGERTYAIQISCPTITIDPAVLPAGIVGTAYSKIFGASGGVGTKTFSITSGALPPGLTLGTNTITGAPTVTGNFEFKLRATDVNGCFGEHFYTLVVEAQNCPTVSISPTATGIAPGKINSPYNLQFSASGSTDPYTFTLATGSNLPSGLSFSSAGLLSGTPTAGGSFSFTVVATSATGCVGSALKVLTIDSCPLITVSPTNANLPPASISTQYSQTFSATGGTGPYSFTLLGATPIGLTFNSATAILAGAPTQAGTFSIEIKATDANGCVGVRIYTLTINSTCPTVTVTPATLPAATVGSPYTQTFSATGGAAPYNATSFSGTPPSGLFLNFTTGVLSGTPTAAAGFTFTIGFRDASNCPAERTYTLIVNGAVCQSFYITSANSALPSGTIKAPYSSAFGATGGTAPLAFKVTTGSLPTGLSLSTNGNLSGTPTTPGDYNFNVRVTDSKGCEDEANFSLLINDATCPTIDINPATGVLAAGTIGSSYTQTFTATGGTAPHNFNLASGALAAGLSLTPNGALSGTPVSTGNYAFTVRATDSSGCTGQKAYTLQISPNLVSSVSAASFVPNADLGTESIAAAFGTGLGAPTQNAESVPLPTVLAGISLKLKDGAGVERLAPLFFISPNQINYQIPPGTSGGIASIEVISGSGVMATGSVRIADVSPGLFSADSTGRGLAAATALRVKANGAQSYEQISHYDTVQNRFVAEPIELGPAGDEVFLVLYGTGWRHRTALSGVSCTIGGVVTEVLYAQEAPGYVGLDQMNARLSRSLAGRGEVDVVVSVDGRVSNIVRVSIR